MSVIRTTFKASVAGLGFIGAGARVSGGRIGQKVINPDFTVRG